ncbi:hypothetical protein BWQ96_02279 [Gracilariopsis chorda]|uniref:Uncharacterized protein n=1 Tax=Gracilariopsis chorda TaxID=448386 RepID=A0A2V3J0Q9_9FLOR|nr:hypothetical protein BWQ96_02279 [Gracilariopsis chorda]|eukprot:PXF47893.1 hypothetical protein BWQ96_02279 [Gracilariopsis chorda]
MHRPLKPPAGYEHFHSEQAVFPGLKRSWKKKESLQDYIDGFKRAWRLYRHSFIHDPEMAAFEEDMLKREELIIQRQAKVVVDKTEKAFKRGQQAAQDVSQQIAQELKDKKPEAQEFLKDRVNILRESLSEFSHGYNDGLEGRFNFFNVSEGDEYPNDVVRRDNKPIVYNSDTEHSKSNANT